MKRLRPIRFPRRKPTRVALLNIYRALHRYYGHRGWWPGETPFEVMVGAILTQNTAWKNVEKAIENLKRRKVLMPSRLLALPNRELARLIRPAGYFNVKTRRLKNFLRFFHDKYQSNVKKLCRTPLDKLRSELLEVNGIGEETADSILLYAVGKRIFVVDAYTRRVFTRHRYLAGSEDYGEIQSFFSKALPKSVALYNDYHAQIVQAGKDYCRKTPLCSSCPLSKYL